MLTKKEEDTRIFQKNFNIKNIIINQNYQPIGINNLSINSNPENNEKLENQNENQEGSMDD